RKQVEETLKQSEERYRTILEEMKDGYFETDLAGNLTFINDALISLLGYSREEIIGMNYRAFTPEEDVKPVFEAYNRMYKTGEPLRDFSREVIRKDGIHGFAQSSAFPIRNDKGEIIGFRGVRHDITEHKKAEEALRRSEERYRTILEEMGDGYFEADLAGNFTFVNDAQARLLGYSKEELIGKNYRDFTPEEKVEPVFQAYKHMYSTGKPLRGFTDEVIRKDGSKGFAETLAFPMRNDKGEIVGFRGIRRDITERKRAEEALRQSEEKYRTILEEMEDSYFEVDLGGHLTFVNNSVCRDLGYSGEELIGMSYKDFTIEENIESVFRVFNEVYQTGVPNKGFPWKTIRKDGSHGFAETSVSLLRDDKGEIIGFRGVGRDITERKQRDERLMMTDRLASIGELASGAAHELNNPLTSIIGFSQLLMEKEVPDDIREDLKLINSEAQRAAIVTNNLLAFAQKHAPMKQPNQINNIIEDVLELRAREHKVNHIDVERYLAPNLPEIMVDYFQMQQVFMNTIINAEYFMTKAHNRGTLTITTQKESSTVRISFADDGPGIPPENLGRVFDPFFTTKEAGKGTGLGLSICHGIVTEHGGQIYVRSQLGKGATIFVEIPIKNRAQMKSIL
ncbi:MAG: PAS domain S-box protein, partial [Chloroflexota bacterium]|nr:PAS domain S-box protein [Chloroflexota bacterium]